MIVKLTNRKLLDWSHGLADQKVLDFGGDFDSPFWIDKGQKSPFWDKADDFEKKVIMVLSDSGKTVESINYL